MVWASGGETGLREPGRAAVEREAPLGTPSFFSFLFDVIVIGVDCSGTRGVLHMQRGSERKRSPRPQGY